jgi:MscS family membrane protein
MAEIENSETAMEPTFSGLERFWTLVIDVWQKGVAGVDIGTIVTAIAIFFAFYIIRRLFTRFVIQRLRALTKRTKWRFDDEILDALERPIRLVPVVVGAFFVDEYLAPAGAYANIGDMFVRSLVAFNIFWILYRAVEPLKFVLAGIEKIFTPAIAEWLIKAIKALIALIGAATILEIWGIQVGPILAGLGLVGVAVALGAQDLFRNLIAGILVLAERRFSQGDWILVDGVVEGIVESIGFRSSVIRRFDKAPVFVPNSKLSDNSLTNFSQMTHRRIYWMIGVEYRTTVDQLRQIRDQIEAYVIDGDEFANPSDVATFVRIDRFGDSSIDIMLYCFTRTTNWGEWLEIKERLAYRIKEIVEGAGTGFAFPSRSVYVETVPFGTPEPFVPPETRDADA